MMRVFLFSFAVIVLLVACVNVDKSKVEKLKKLKPQLEEVELIIAKVNLQEVEEKHTIAEQSLKFLSRNFRDTMSLKKGIFFADYRADRKLLGKVLEQHEACMTELAKCKKQQADLLADVKANLVNDSQFNAYIQEEENAVFELKEQANIMVANYEKVIPRYDAKNAEVQEFVEGVKAKMAKEAE